MAEREALLAWLEETAGLRGARLEPLAGDASFRRYFRVRAQGQTWVLVDAPPEREPLEPFLRAAAALRGLGLRVPQVLAADPHRGLALLEDLGDRLYLRELEAVRRGEAPWARAEALYGAALEALRRLQRAPVAGAPFPPYDEALVREEMLLFRDWLLARHLGVDPTPWEEVLEAAFDRLAAAFAEQPRVWVHRDYHSRNLLVAEPGPGILDFQDAVVGPVTYDLVSLLRDCYLRWPEAAVQAWAEGHRLALAAEGLVGADAATFRRWLDLTGAQRHLKAAGIFARLWHRDGKAGYLADLPRTLGHLARELGPYGELAGLRRLVLEEVLPRLDRRGQPLQRR